MSLAAKRIVAVAVGGLVGSGLRAAVALSWPVGGTWPWSTFTVNLAGAAALGFLVARLRQTAAPPWAVELWGIGLLGSFTTFSTFAVEVWGLATAGRPLLAGTYGVVSVAAGLVAAVVGTRTGGAR